MSLAAAFSVIGGVLAVAICSFGLGLLIRRLASRFGVRPWWEEFKASLKRAVSAPKLDAVGPVGWLAIWSVVRASLVQAGKWGAENAAAWIFTGWGALFVIGGIAALVILVPESAIKWLSYLKTQNRKEKDDVGASSPERERVRALHVDTAQPWSSSYCWPSLELLFYFASSASGGAPAPKDQPSSPGVSAPVETSAPTARASLHRPPQLRSSKSRTRR